MVQSGSWVYESGLRTDLGGGEGIEEATDEVTIVEDDFGGEVGRGSQSESTM